MIGFLLVAAYILIFFLSHNRPRNRFDDSSRAQVPSPVWWQVAESFGLGLEVKLSTRSLYGYIEGCEVTIEVERGGATIRVRPDTRALWGIRIARRGLTDDRPTIGTGDVDLDRATIIEGDRATLLAAFDPLTRELLCNAIGDGPIYIARGSVRAELDADIVSADRVVDIVRSMLALAQRLTRTKDAGEALLENAKYDPVAAVRLENLRVLLGDVRNRALAGRAAETALQDGDLDVRRMAASFLGVELPASGGHLSLVSEASEQGALSFDRQSGALSEENDET